MNRKQFCLVLLALAIIGGAGLVLLKHNRNSWETHEAKVGDKVLPAFPINNVARIHVRGDSDFTVARTNGLWCVLERNNYPADFALISDLLMKLRDLKVMQSDIVGPSQLGRLGLEPPGKSARSGLLLEFKDERGQLIASLLAGKKHDRPQNPSEPMGLHGLFDARYVLLPSDPQNILLTSDELAAATPETGAWLKKDFFKVENIKRIAVRAARANNSWEISREAESSPWVLANAGADEALDQKVAAEISEILAFPTFADVVPKAAYFEAEKATLVTITTENLLYTFHVGEKNSDGNRMFKVDIAPNASAADSKAAQAQLAVGKALAPWVFSVNTWIDIVMRDRSQLLGKQTPTNQTASR